MSAQQHPRHETRFEPTRRPGQTRSGPQGLATPGPSGPTALARPSRRPARPNGSVKDWKPADPNTSRRARSGRPSADAQPRRRDVHGRALAHQRTRRRTSPGIEPNNERQPIWTDQRGRTSRHSGGLRLLTAYLRQCHGMLHSRPLTRLRLNSANILPIVMNSAGRPLGRNN